MSKEPYQDARGNKVEVGDTLAVAFRSSSTAHIRIGKVVGFDSKANGWSEAGQPLLIMEWERMKELSSFRPETSKIHADTYGRFVIIEKGVVDAVDN